MSLPNFIGVGAQRAATTWAYQCLKEHPDVYMSDVKEIHFFDENYEKGLDWYQKYFEASKGCKAIGEITPNYLNVPKAIPAIAKDIPDAHLFVILREPIARAYSAYKLLNEKFGHLSFQEACESTNYFLSLSRYADGLKRMYCFFPKEQVKVFFYEDVKSRPQELLQELFRFVGVDDSFQPKSSKQVYNAIIMPGVQSFASHLKLDWLIELFKKTSLGQWTKSKMLGYQCIKLQEGLEQGRVKNAERQIASPEYVKYLKEYFQDDIYEVQTLTKRDLSSWL